MNLSSERFSGEASGFSDRFLGKTALGIGYQVLDGMSCPETFKHPRYFNTRIFI
jgi:hypothetical protein